LSDAPPREASPPEVRSAPAASDATPLQAPVPGRGRLREYALSRLKQSWWLRASAVAAFLCYGAIPYLIYARHAGLSAGLTFWHAGLLLIMSLASWSLLFWWYPVLERTLEVLGRRTHARAIAAALEGVAIACVAVVHLLMSLIIVWQGVSAS
jgi:hypothetical protein